jgi:hypothetical protein
MKERRQWWIGRDTEGTGHVLVSGTIDSEKNTGEKDIA